MKHKHSEIATRWLNDTSLVILIKHIDGQLWRKAHNQECQGWSPRNKYFLSLEKHVPEALHWLNGGDVEIIWDGVWRDLRRGGGFCHFENAGVGFRVKPEHEKVKVWVGITKGGDSIMAFDSDPANNQFMGNYTWTQVEVSKEINQ
jgi:hypothetical protein